MKKKILLILPALLSVSAIAACGGNSSQGSTTNISSSSKDFSEFLDSDDDGLYDAVDPAPLDNTVDYRWVDQKDILRPTDTIHMNFNDFIVGDEAELTNGVLQFASMCISTVQKDPKDFKIDFKINYLRLTAFAP